MVFKFFFLYIKCYPKVLPDFQMFLYECVRGLIFARTR